MPTDRLLVTIATYNERENLPRLLDEVLQHAPQADILVVDDNSPDGTGDLAAQRSAADRRIFLLRRSGKLGLGTAMVAAIRYAIEHGYDLLLNLDGDFSHDPSYIPALLAGMGRADVMIGSRYVPGGDTPDWPRRRRIMSRLVNTYARWALGLAPRDCSGAFRCYRVSLLEQLDLMQVRSRGYAFQEEILWHLKRVGARFGESPIVFTDRQYGRSKINAQEALTALWVIFVLGLRNLFYRRAKKAAGETSMSEAPPAAATKQR